MVYQVFDTFRPSVFAVSCFASGFHAKMRYGPETESSRRERERERERERQREKKKRREQKRREEKRREEKRREERRERESAQVLAGSSESEAAAFQV